MASPQEMADTMVKNVEDKTGKVMNDWLEIIKQSGLEKHGQIIKMLKGDHGFANLIALTHLNPVDPDGSLLITNQYAGAKQPLKVIYDSIMNKLSGLEGIEIAPKKAYVSLRHNKQFALIQPSTKTRVDVGLNLKGDEPTERLEKSGSFNAMVSHRVRLTDVSQIDDELINWLKEAHKRN